VIQVSDVANRQPEDFDFRELFVRRQGRQQLSQLGECRIEGFDSNSLPDEININYLECRARRQNSECPVIINRLLIRIKSDSTDFYGFKDRRDVSSRLSLRFARNYDFTFAVTLPRGVCGSILLRGPSSPAPLLPRQGARAGGAYPVNSDAVAAVRHRDRSVLARVIATEALHVTRGCVFEKVPSNLRRKILLSPSR